MLSWQVFLLKMGAYGFLRISFPMFPHAVKVLFIPLLILSVIAIIYGAYVTFDCRKT